MRRQAFPPTQQEGSNPCWQQPQRNFTEINLGVFDLLTHQHSHLHKHTPKSDGYDKRLYFYVKKLTFWWVEEREADVWKNWVIESSWRGEGMGGKKVSQRAVKASIWPAENGDFFFIALSLLEISWKREREGGRNIEYGWRGRAANAYIYICYTTNCNFQSNKWWLIIWMKINDVSFDCVFACTLIFMFIILFICRYLHFSFKAKRHNLYNYTLNLIVQKLLCNFNLFCTLLNFKVYCICLFSNKFYFTINKIKFEKNT